MFTFFSKKSFLIDHLPGLVDIHNHILPGIDDGAKTIEESIEMINALQQYGINELICTPHIMHNYYDNTPKTIEKAYQKLAKSLKGRKIIGITITYAAEHMIDDDFEKKLEENQIIPLNEDHLLIEMSYLQPSINFNQALERINNKGLFPIFAHPERYQYLNSDKKSYAVLKSQGLKFQLNLLSLGGYYGADVQKTALYLLEDGFYDYLGSDVHNLRQIDYIKSIKLKRRHVSHFLRLIHSNRTLV